MEGQGDGGGFEVELVADGEEGAMGNWCGCGRGRGRGCRFVVVFAGQGQGDLVDFGLVKVKVDLVSEFGWESEKRRGRLGPGRIAMRVRTMHVQKDKEQYADQVEGLTSRLRAPNMRLQHCNQVR